MQETRIQNREEAGLLLSRKLHEYEKTNAVVVGIPRSGVCVAAAIANTLSLPLEVMTCQRIKHPVNDQKNLGSVCLTEVCIPDSIESIPQDFVAHQIVLLKNANLFDYNFYHEQAPKISLRYKPVILVDDLLKSGDTMLVCLHEIRKQNPLKIIVAVPIVSAEAARMIGAEADETVFLKMEHEVGHAKNYFADDARINKDQVKQMLSNAKRNLSPFN